MRFPAVALVALLPLVGGVAVGAQPGLVEPRDPHNHARFLRVLQQAHEDLSSAVTGLDGESGTRAAEGRGSGARTGAPPELLTTAKAERLTASINSMRKVRNEVTATSELATEIQHQVAWDLERMISDAERLNSPSLSAPARTALTRALDLRFGVLLSPAFWNTPIKAELMQGEGGGAKGAAPS